MDLMTFSRKHLSFESGLITDNERENLVSLRFTFNDIDFTQLVKKTTTSLFRVSISANGKDVCQTASVSAADKITCPRLSH